MEAFSNKIVINQKKDEIGNYKEVIVNDDSVDILLYIVGDRIILSRCKNKTNDNNYEWRRLHLLFDELVKRKQILVYQQVEILKTSTLYKDNDCLDIKSPCNLVRLGFKENTVSTTCVNLIESLEQMKQVSEPLAGGSKKYKRKSRKVYKSRRSKSRRSHCIALK